MGLWHRLTWPVRADGEVEAQQAQLMCSIALALVGFAGFTLLPLVGLAFIPPQQVQPLVGSALITLLSGGTAVGISLTAYALSRQARVTQAAWLVTVTLSVLIHATAVSNLANETHYMFYYLLVPTLLAAFFLRLRSAVAVTVINLAVMLLLGALMPGLAFFDLPLIFVSVMGTLTLLFRQHLVHLENARSLAAIHAEQARSAALQASEVRYRTLFEAMSEAVIVVRDGVQVAVNPAYVRMFGISEAEAIGQPLRARFSTGSPPPNADEEATTRRFYQVQAVRADGSSFDAEVHLRAMQAADGHAAQLCTIRDVTARKEAEAIAHELELEQAHLRRMRQFVRDVSHDLRTPLAVILNGLHLIRVAPDADYRGRKIASTELQVKHIAAMLDNLLSIERLDKAADNRLQPMPYDLNALAAQCAKDQRWLADERAITLALALEPTLPIITMDPDEMLRAVRQFVMNAIAYTPLGGTVTIRTGHDADTVWLEVADTGIGMSEDEQVRIFELFYRAETSRLGGQGVPGLGVGLTISQRVVRAHGGRIDVYSASGEGSRFRVVLPLSAVAVPPLPPGSASAAHEQ